MSMKRVKLSCRNFLDLEARESEGSTTDESEDERSLDNFIQDDDNSGVTIENTLYQDLGLDRDEEQDEHQVAEVVARAKLRAAKNASSNVSLASDLEHFASTFNSSIFSGSKLWELIVKTKTEAHLAEVMNEEYGILKLREEEKLAQAGASSEHDSRFFAFQAFYVKGLHGRVFVATDDLKQAAQKLTPYIVDKTAFRNFSRVLIAGDTSSISGKSALDYFFNQSSPELDRYQWVRVRRGRYRGDAALVLHPRSHKTPNLPMIAVVPRFDEQNYIEKNLGSSAAQAQGARGSKSTRSSGQTNPSSGAKRRRRQAAQLLSGEVYHSMNHKGIFRTYGNRTFLDGLEVLFPKLTNLEVHPVLRDDEIEPFVNIEVSSRACLHYFHKRRSSDLQPGDQVSVTRGQHAGFIGVVHDIDLTKEPVSVEIIVEDEIHITLDWDEIQRELPVGTWVRIAWGRDKGRVGVIVRKLLDGLANIWAPHTAYKIKNVFGATSVEETMQDMQTRVEKSAAEEICTFQDFLEIYNEPVLFENLRHPFAPGIITPTDHRIQADQGKETDDCARPQGVLMDSTQPKKKPFFSFGRTIRPQENNKHEKCIPLRAQRDHRIGKDAQIIATGLKGYFGRILDISSKTVTIELGGRIPPYATVNLNQAVCLNQLDCNMAGGKLKKPLKMPTMDHRDPMPLQRFRTPSPEASVTTPVTTAVSLGEAAFLIDEEITSHDFHIFVRFGLGYDGAKWYNRIRHTDKKSFNTVMNAAFDLSMSPEIIVNWMDSHNAQPIRRAVPVAMLKRVPPSKKGQQVVILRDGNLYGWEGTVQHFSRKDKTASVSIGWEEHTFSWDDLCRISTMLPT